MEFFESWRRNRAARRCRRKLGPWLRRNYGASGSYTREQVDRGIERLRFDSRYVVFAYAFFLTQDAFEGLAGGLPVAMGYDDAREFVAHSGAMASYDYGGIGGGDFGGGDFGGGYDGGGFDGGGGV